MRRHQSKGLALGTTLIVIAVVVALAFALSSTSVFHLSNSTKMTHQSQAESLAESVLSLAIERLMSDIYFGYNREPEDTLVFKPEPGKATSFASLSYHVPTAEANKYPYSTNNLTGDAALEGWDGRVVPAGTVHLVGTGEVGGVRKSVEAILHLPGFRYAIASSGAFSSDGQLLVAGLPEDEELPEDGISSLDSTSLLPGHILSNSTRNDNLKAESAIKIGLDSKITGDVQSVGGIVLEPGVQVLGDINSGAEEEAIPVISVKALDPETLEKSNIQYVKDTTLDKPFLSGWVRVENDLAITGGLHLDGAAIYIDGDLRVDGGIHGTGAVIVKGATSVVGGAELNSDSELALISEGDISLTGTASSESYFEGLVYTEGDFTAEELTIVGSFIANGDDSTVSLNNTNFVKKVGDGEVKFDVSNPLGEPFYFKEHGGKFLGKSLVEPGKKTTEIYIRKDTLGTDTHTIYEPKSGERFEGLSPVQVRNQTLLWLGDLCCSKHNTKDFASTEGAFYSEISNLLTPDEMEAAHIEEEFKLNPSSFLKFEDQIQLLVWRVL